MLTTDSSMTSSPSIPTWLDSLGLKQYSDLFSNYKGVESLLVLSEADIKNLGVNNGGHRASIVSSLFLIKHQNRRRSRDIYKMHSSSLPRALPANQNFLLPSHDLKIRRANGTLLSQRRQGGSLKENLKPSNCSTQGVGGWSSLRRTMDASPEKLRKDLEEELKLDSNDIRSHAWFHGMIPRTVAENYVTGNGDFLIRDCISQPGDFVLTCRCKGQALHFIINKVVLHPNTTYSRIQYQFEKESFDSIPSLVRFYVGNRKPISEGTGAIIYHPINRTLPLSYTDAKYGSTQPERQSPAPAILRTASTPSPKGSSHSTPTGSPHAGRRIIHGRSGSQPVTLSPEQLLSVSGRMTKNPSESNLPSARDVEAISLIKQQSAHSGSAQDIRVEKRNLQRCGSDPTLLSPGVERRKFFHGSNEAVGSKPPPKPSRTPSVRQQQRPKVEVRNKEKDQSPEEEIYIAQHDYSELDPAPPVSWQPLAKGEVRLVKLNDIPDYARLNTPKRSKETMEARKRRIMSDTRFSVLSTASLDSLGDELDAEEDSFEEVVPSIVIETESSFNPVDFTTCLLPSENKPLDNSAVVQIRSMLLDGSAKTIAQHMTRVDCEVARIVDVSEEQAAQMGVSSGLELMTLPHGELLRTDLIERHTCIYMWVSVTILTCTGGDKERAGILHKFIEVAAELRGTMGNLFGFSAIMKALESPHISRLYGTWVALRQHYTTSAVKFDSKLKPVLKTLNSSTSTIPLSNTCFPHVIPFLQLMANDVSDMELAYPWDSSDDYGLDAVLAHVDAMRSVAQQPGLYKITAESRLQGLKVDDTLLDVFRTELHMKLLWGSKGALANQKDRYMKFEKVLKVISDRVEPPETEM
ncbi:breast cancer anti-estrogen resistance protein 3 homolog isoform X1 [Branchiostoma floridae x Branchiostoma japonicum]